MFKKVIMFLSIIIGLSFGFSVGPMVWKSLNISNGIVSNTYVNALIFGIVFMVLGFLVTPLVARLIRKLQEIVNRQTTTTLLFGTMGILLGLLLGYLVSLPFTSLEIPFLSSTLPLIFSITLALVGYQTATSRKEELRKLFSRHDKQAASKNKVSDVDTQILERKAGETFRKYKLLDTSVIIDGRIADIVKTNFLEGVIVIPNFVLTELQYIADSSDSLKRAKGRRGLDILNELQKDSEVPIEFYEGDFEDITEVDSKLIRLAKLIDAAIVTNDYNLNKVCEFQNVRVFNINALANAVKPVVIPGEEMKVLVIKAGTERKQGVAYLEDGTMIVVEDGQYYMNEWIHVVVTSALQTAAGRMIFAKPVHQQDKLETQDN